jgi:hypothetical protein
METNRHRLGNTEILGCSSMQTHGAKFGIVLGFFKDKTDQNISLSLK